MQETEFQTAPRLVRANLTTAQKRYRVLRMAPMIDIIFLLLIFFLVAARWAPHEDFLPFELSTASAGGSGAAKAEPLEIYICGAGDGCEVRIAGLHIVQIRNDTIDEDLAVLIQRLREVLGVQKRFASDPVEIICAPEVKWVHLARIYNLFYGAGLTDITFQTTE